MSKTDTPPSGGLATQRGDARGDRGRRDRLEGAQRVTVVEDDGGERCPVERPVVSDHAVAEALPDEQQGVGARLDDLASDSVGVDDMGTEGAQSSCDARLARSDASGDSDAQHGRQSASRGGKPPRATGPSASA